MLTGQGSVTSWSSWRSFTVTLLWSSGWVPLGKTPSLVITTGWRTLKSRAMANTSDGTRSEGSDTVTISISASCPVTETEGEQAVAQSHMEFITTPTCWLFLFRDEDGVSRGEGEQSEKKADFGKATPSAVWQAFSCDCRLQPELVLMSVAA